MEEVLRQAIFNGLMDNTDDHERNHALLSDDSGALQLSPAFDVSPSGKAQGYQQMRLGKQAHESTIDNVLSEAAQHGLRRMKEVDAVLREVIEAVSGWRDHFRAIGCLRQILTSWRSRSIDRRCWTSAIPIGIDSRHA